MNQTIKKTQIAINSLTLMSCTVVLASCAATQTMVEHHNLESNTRLSQTLFLDPVPQNQKTIYLSVRNTSNESININKPLVTALSERGYRVVTNPNGAHYLLQANILKVAKMSRSASSKMLGGGFGSTLVGAGAGASLGALTGNSNAMIAGGLAGGVIGLAADSLVKEVNYTMVTDVQISERVAKGVVVREHFSSSLGNGSTSGTKQTSSKEGNYQRYRTRIVSDVNKVNLSFVQARPVLETDLVKTLSGIF